MSHVFNSTNAFYYSHEGGRVSCPVCGKMFDPAPEHSYKIGKYRNKLVCTYTCMRKWEKGEVKKLEVQPKKSRLYGAVKIVETGEIFDNCKECAKHLGAAYTGVQRAVKKGYSCKGFHIVQAKEGEKNA